MGNDRRAWLLALCLVLTAPAFAASTQTGAAADPAALFDALRSSHDPIRQIQLIDAIGRLGDPAGPSAAPVKAAVRTTAPGLFLGIISSADADWSVRGEALNALRMIDAPDAVVKQAIAAAEADTGEHAGYLRRAAVALQSWSDSRATREGVPAQNDADAQRRAALFLQQHDIRVTYDALSDALGDGQSGMVASLLSAGLKVGGDASKRATMAVLNGLTTACDETPVPSDGVAQSLSFLVGHGMPASLPDESGNTLLMSAAQYCPPPIAERLLVLGAAVDPVNKQHFTPLQMAFVSGKWDVAKLLIDHGARITRQQADQIFFQPPEDQAQRDLIAQAIR